MAQPNADLPHTTVPSFSILSDGTALDVSQVVSLSISTEIGKIPQAEVVLNDGSMAKRTFEISSTNRFIPGSVLEIKAGYQQTNKSIFKGVVVKHGIRTTLSQNSTLTIELKHALYKAALTRKSGIFMKQKDSDTLDSILGTYAVEKSVEDTQTEHLQMVQMNCTDWDFVNLRAEANNLLVLPKPEKTEIKKPETSAPEKVTLEFGVSLIEADLELDNRVAFENFEGQTWDSAEQEISSASSTLTGLSETGNLPASELASKANHHSYVVRNGASLAENELIEVLNTQKSRSLLSKIRGIVKCEGTSDVQIGDMVKLAGLGDRFNGKALVTGVMHDIGPGRWFTTLQIGLNAESFLDRFSDVNEKPAGGLLPAVNGLQVGIVSTIIPEQDEPNILVRIPITTAREEGVWARVARLDAGSNRGAVFHPEENDEVILGFVNDDPRQAVILGMLNSSKNNVPDELKAAQDNPVKGFITRSELKLLFDDKKGIITLETPQGKVVIDDDRKSITINDDSNQNSITLSDKGITIECGKDLTISARGNVKIEGKKVEIKASGSLSAEGSGGVSLKSNGITEIKGSMVNIN
ncbi:type VI secretion system tip protein VgrG [Larkinella rosea]|uniref:Type VI secretion system tip protein VgrG n=1 Tax=Larkinella rosea TaxID=2025312 RepID=A0A3P1C3C1_9BACT|nr:type VI secretion system tip protein VgrG [Larkinella rosea]RRB07759.1 type VI secretion system tip protein VgrG [Larkinella rosea]